MTTIHPPADAGKRGIQARTALAPIPPRPTPPPPRRIRDNDARVRSHAHANQALDDQPYLAYALVQAMKLAIALLCKRWPMLK